MPGKSEWDLYEVYKHYPLLWESIHGLYIYIPKQVILHFKCAYKHLGNIKQNITTFHNMTFFVFFDGSPICVFYNPYCIIYLHLTLTY